MKMINSSRKSVLFLVAMVMISALYQPATMAKDSEISQSIPEQIEELSKISKLVSLEAKIAREQAKREKAIAEIETARARRAWARVEKYKAEMKLKQMKESPNLNPDACCKEEKKVEAKEVDKKSK